MPQPISEPVFRAYCDQALARWRKLEALRIGHLALQQRLERAARINDNITLALAILTAGTALVQLYFPAEENETGVAAIFTAVVGFLTAASTIIKDQKKWTERVSQQKELLASIQGGLSNIRQWIEMLSRGSLPDSDELLTNQIDSLVNSVLEKGSIPDFAPWLSSADERLQSEGLLNVPFFPTTDVQEETPANDVAPIGAAELGEAGGIQRAVRGGS